MGMNEKVLEGDGRGRSTLLLALMLNVAVFALLLVLFRVAYEANDDATIANMVNGVKSIRTDHIVFSHVLIGRLYMALYGITTKLSWYLLVQWSLCFAALTAGAMLILERCEKRLTGIILALLMLLVFGFECYIRVTFTKTAGIAAGAGALLLLEELTKDVRKTGRLIAGGILAILAFLMRAEEAVVCILFLSGAGLWHLLEAGDRKVCLRRLRSYAVCLALLGAVFGVLKYTDSRAYRSDEGWNSYLDFNDARSAVLDYKVPPYWEHQQEYLDLGIDQDTFAMFTSWNFADPDVFPTPLFQQISAMQGKVDYINKANVKEYLKRFPWEFTQIRAFFWFLAMFALWLLQCWRSKRSWLVAVYEILMFGGAYYVLFVRGRYLMNRTDTPMWFCLGFIFFLMIQRQNLKKIIPVTACAIAALLVFHHSDYAEWRHGSPQIRTYQQRRAGEIAGLRKIAEDPDHLYLLKAFIYNSGGYYDPFEYLGEGVMDHTVLLCGWTVWMPTYKETLAQWNITNPFRDAVDNDQVRLVDDQIESTTKYMQIHYGDDIVEKKVRQVGGQTVYKLIRKPKKN